MSNTRRSLLATQTASDIEAEATVRRSMVVVCLLLMALIHLLDVEHKMDEAFVIGVLFIPLTIVSLVLAEALIRYDEPLVWAAAGVVAGATLLGFILSRTVGLPGEGGHEIGKWTGMLGLSSMLVEAVIVWMVIARFSRRSD